MNKPYSAVLSQAATRGNTLATTLEGKEREKAIHEVTELLRLRRLVERIVYHARRDDKASLFIAVDELVQGVNDD